MIAAARAVCSSMRSSLSFRYSGSAVPLDIFRRLFPAAMRMTFSGWFNSCATDVNISPRVASLDDLDSGFFALSVLFVAYVIEFCEV
ncbi:MAG: hypothetical protein ACI9W2_000598 [Gammaproteobacteria bacterium]|jgi:hypothetical protein